ncbi:MAG: NPCBM/NEW2 domain-containing protein [Planctomycetota bacterium]
MIQRLAFRFSLGLVSGLFSSAGLAQTVPAPAGAGPQVVVLGTDGQLRSARLLELTAAAARLEPANAGAAGGRGVELPLRELIAIHADDAAPLPPASALARLVGGEALRGAVAGGDQDGEFLTFESGSLGRCEIPIDRLALLVFLDRATPSGLERLLPGERAPKDECVYRVARRGFDLRFGEIHRFGADGLYFATAEEPQRLPYTELAGVGIRGGVERETAAAAILITRAGDRVGGDDLRFADGRWTFRLEGDRELMVDGRELTSVTPRNDRFVPLADLPDPVVDERSYFGAGESPLWRWRRDQSALGETLRSAGRVFARGVGVHAKSRLRWVAPSGASGFTGLVAIDDSVRDLTVRGQVDVTVAIDEQVVFERKALTASDGLVPLGLLAVRAGQTVELFVDFGPGLDLGDRVNWLDVGFVVDR